VKYLLCLLLLSTAYVLSHILMKYSFLLKSSLKYLTAVAGLLLGALSLAVMPWCYSRLGDLFWFFIPLSLFSVLFLSPLLFKEPLTNTKLSAYILIISGIGFILFSSDILTWFRV